MYKYVKVKAYGVQIIHRILAQVQLTVVGPLTDKVVASLVPGCVVGMDIRGRQCSLNCRVRVNPVERPGRNV